MKFGITTDVTNFEGPALAAQLRVPADIARLDETALRNNCGFPFDVTCGYRTSGSTKNDVPINVADRDASCHCHEVEMHVPGSDNLPHDGAFDLVCGIALIFDDFLAAVFLNLDGIVFNLHIDCSLTTGRVDLQISDSSSHYEARSLGNGAFSKTREVKTKSQGKAACERSNLAHHLVVPTNCRA